MLRCAFSSPLFSLPSQQWGSSVWTASEDHSPDGLTQPGEVLQSSPNVAGITHSREGNQPWSGSPAALGFCLPDFGHQSSEHGHDGVLANPGKKLMWE